LWEAVLPAELRQLPPELARVDAILEDDRVLIEQRPEPSPPLAQTYEVLRLSFDLSVRSSAERSS